MAENIRPIADTDISKSWVVSSRFLFYTSVFCLLAFVFACSVRLYQSTYKGVPKVEVPESTKYSPSYKK